MNQFTRDSLVQFIDLLKAAEDSITEVSKPMPVYSKDFTNAYTAGWNDAIDKFFVELMRTTMTPIQAAEIQQMATALKRR